MKDGKFIRPNPKTYLTAKNKRLEIISEILTAHFEKAEHVMSERELDWLSNQIEDRLTAVNGNSAELQYRAVEQMVVNLKKASKYLKPVSILDDSYIPDDSYKGTVYVEAGLRSVISQQLLNKHGITYEKLNASIELIHEAARTKIGTLGKIKLSSYKRENKCAIDIANILPNQLTDYRKRMIVIGIMNHDNLWHGKKPSEDYLKKRLSYFSQ